MPTETHGPHIFAPLAIRILIAIGLVMFWFGTVGAYLYLQIVGVSPLVALTLAQVILAAVMGLCLIGIMRHDMRPAEARSEKDQWFSRASWIAVVIATLLMLCLEVVRPGLN